MTALAPLHILGLVGRATTDQYASYETAQAHADRTQTPCGVWARGPVFAASEVAPEFDWTDRREDDGWSLVAVCDPWDWDAN